MPQPTLKQLDAFVQVADLGSFRRAANRLNTTQPNISARISALEDLLGQSLMQRDAGSVRLTAAGDRLLSHARDVLRATDRLVAAAGDPTLIDGTLRLGVTEMVVHSWLGSYLTGLADKFPSLALDLTVDYSTNLSAALFDRTIDLALQTEPFDRQTSGLVEIGNFPMIWVGAPKLDLSRRKLSLSDLAKHALLTHARGTLPFEQLSAHLATQNTPARLVPSTNMVACLHMTRDGLGVACLPEAMVRGEIADGNLTALAYDWTPDPLVFFARYLAESAPDYVQEAAHLAAEVATTFDREK